MNSCAPKLPNSRNASIPATYSPQRSGKGRAGISSAYARLRALKLTFLLLTALGLLAFVPAGRLPDYKPDEVPG